MRGFKHPKGYYSIFSIVLLERISYYGFGSIFMLLLIKILNMDAESAYDLRTNFISILFIVPIVGGALADKFIGYKRALYFSVLSSTLGNLIMASNAIYASGSLLYAGLIMLAIGFAFFRPALYFILGSIYQDKNDARRDSGFTLLYFATNLGAFLAPFLILYMAESVAWWLGFVLAGLISLSSVLLIKRLEEPVVDKKKSFDVEDKQSLYLIGIMAVIVFVVWGVISATLGILSEVFLSISMSGVHTNISNFWIQAISGGLFGVILVPFFAWLWVKLSDSGKNPATLKKIFLGFTLACITILGMYAILADYRASGKINIAWLFIFSFIFTSAELFVGPIVMSLVTKLSPIKIGATVLGAWFLLNYMLNNLATNIVPTYSADKEFQLFMIPALLALAVALFIILMYKKLNKWMKGVL